MSTKIMLEIARHSTAKGNAKLVLLLLASYAHPDGTHAEMSLSTIAREAGLSRRQVNTIVHFLAETGHVRLESAAGAHGTNRYAVQRLWLNQGNHFPSATTSPGAIAAPLGQSLPTIEKETKNLKKQSCEAIALGQPLPQGVGQSLPQDHAPSPAITPAAAKWIRTFEHTLESPDFAQVLQGKDPQPPGSPAPPLPPRKYPFDAKKYALGDPCPTHPTHRYGDTGQSLRWLKDDTCANCTLVAKRAGAHRQVQGG